MANCNEPTPLRRPKLKHRCQCDHNKHGLAKGQGYEFRGLADLLHPKKKHPCAKAAVSTSDISGRMDVKARMVKYWGFICVNCGRIIKTSRYVEGGEIVSKIGATLTPTCEECLDERQYLVADLQVFSVNEGEETSE